MNRAELFRKIADPSFLVNAANEFVSKSNILHLRKAAIVMGYREALYGSGRLSRKQITEIFGKARRDELVRIIEEEQDLFKRFFRHFRFLMDEKNRVAIIRTIGDNNQVRAAFEVIDEFSKLLEGHLFRKSELMQSLAEQKKAAERAIYKDVITHFIEERNIYNKFVEPLQIAGSLAPIIQRSINLEITRERSEKGRKALREESKVVGRVGMFFGSRSFAGVAAAALFAVVFITGCVSRGEVVSPREVREPPAKVFGIEDKKLADDIESVYIVFLKNGELAAKAWHGNDLDKSDEVFIPGSFVAMILFVANNTTPIVDGMSLYPIEVNGSGHPFYLTSPRSSTRIDEEYFVEGGFFTMDYLLEKCKNTVEGGFRRIAKGGYSIGYFPGYFGRERVLFKKKEIPIIFETPNGTIKKRIIQIPSIQVGEHHGIKVELVGLNQIELDQDSRNKIQEIAKTSNRINKTFAIKSGHDFVNLITIIKYGRTGPRIGRKEIELPLRWLKETGLIELRVIFTHETLHEVVGSFKIAPNHELIDFFGLLFGFPQSKIDMMKKNQGHDPFSIAHEPTKNKEFLYFITEKHFFGIFSGGHPATDTHEFFTSFLHTTLYPTQLKENLNKLPTEKRKEIINIYKRVLIEMIRGSSGNLKKHLKAMLGEVPE